MARDRDLPYPKPGSSAVSAIMRGNRCVDTGPEVALRSALHGMGLRFHKDRRVHAGEVRVKVDIVFPTYRVAVFVDGCFWHSCPEHGRVPARNPGYWPTKLARNRERDRRVNTALRREGWTVLRLWEHVAVEEAVQHVLAALAAATNAEDPKLRNRRGLTAPNDHEDRRPAPAQRLAAASA